MFVSIIQYFYPTPEIVKSKELAHIYANFGSWAILLADSRKYSTPKQKPEFSALVSQLLIST